MHTLYTHTCIIQSFKVDTLLRWRNLFPETQKPLDVYVCMDSANCRVLPNELLLKDVPPRPPHTKQAFVILFGFPPQLDDKIPLIKKQHVGYKREKENWNSLNCQLFFFQTSSHSYAGC